MLSASRIEVSGEVPGFESVATAIGTPMFAEERDRRRLPLAQSVERARQQDRDDAGVRHRFDARFVGIFEMVGGEGAELGRQRRAAAVRQLVGVKLDRQSEAPGRVEHKRDLRDGERDALAERVDRIDEALAGERRHGLADHRVDIGLAIVRRIPAESHARREGWCGP